MGDVEKDAMLRHFGDEAIRPLARVVPGGLCIGAVDEAIGECRNVNPSDAPLQ